MTLKKLAELACVSPSTVSKVLSGSREISKETAQQVFRTAEENGMCLKKRKRVEIDPDIVRVSILVPELISVYYSQLVTDFYAALTESNIIPSVNICGFEMPKIVETVDSLVHNGLTNGIICISPLKYKNTTEVPIVIFDAKSTKDFDSVSSGIHSGIVEAVDYLKKLGHTQIGFIGEIHTPIKRQFFMDALKVNALTAQERFIWTSNKRFEEIGYEAVGKMLQSEDRPTAIIAAYDEIALGAIHALQNNGMCVPQDVSVIGINNIPFSAYFSVPLTTIQTYRQEKISLIVNLLLDKIKSGNRGMIQHISIQSELIIRDTTAPVCGKKG